MDDPKSALPKKPHPLVNLFTDSLNNKANGSGAKPLKSSKLQKLSQVLGWRNRFSQDELYPIDLALSCDTAHKNPYKFHVKQVQRGEIEETYGTGATVWPASMVLLKYLEHMVVKNDGRIWNLVGKTKGDSMNIGDLGAGTGVTSIAAALLFDKSFVICTDGCEKVVDLAKENIGNVGMLEGKGFYKLGSSLLRGSKYWWGDGTIVKELHSVKGVGASFDIILVSDCVLPKLYPIAPLIDALDECMSPSTIAYCTYEYRYYPDYDPKEYFIKLATMKGLVLRQVPTHDQHPIYSIDDIELWEIRRCTKAK